jgi:hypothetical protein
MEPTEKRSDHQRSAVPAVSQISLQWSQPERGRNVSISGLTPPSVPPPQ